MRKLLAIISCLCFCTVSVAETLNIAIEPFNPPFETRADHADRFLGFDIAMMMEICRRIDATCRFNPMTFEQIFAKVLSNEVDMGVSAIVITGERQQVYSFSLPYLESSAQFITKDANKFSTISDIRTKRIGVERGTIFKSAVEQLVSGSAKIIDYKSVADLMQALATDKVDAIMLDTNSAAYWVANDAQYQLLGQKIPLGIGYGIMTNKLNTPLIERVNSALLNIQNDGTYKRLYNGYFFPLSN